jgi:chromosome segregation ATPase
VLVGYLQQQQEGDGPDVTDTQRELKRLQRQRAALTCQDQRLLDAYQVGALELDELKGRRQRLREAEQQLQQREQTRDVPGGPCREGRDLAGDGHAVL